MFVANANFALPCPIKIKEDIALARWFGWFVKPPWTKQANSESENNAKKGGIFVSLPPFVV
jgi:hypothetical protein